MSMQRGHDLRLLMAFVMMLSCATTAHAESEVPTSQDRTSTPELRIPIDGGKIELRTVIDGVYESFGITPPDAVERITWRIDVRSVMGRAQLDAIRRATGGVLAFRIEDEHVVVAVDPTPITDQAAQTQGRIEQWLEGVTELFAAQQRVFGMTIVTADDPRVPLDAYVDEQGALPERAVVLVHGLDDPGWMWRDLTPALHEAGHTVVRFEYPNDGPISEAADLLAFSLMDLPSEGVDRVDIVAHSMGGLVARDVLTRAAFFGGDGSGGGGFPAVDRLIMCGTPNHGSKMVRLRAVSEIKEQVSRVFSGDAVWLGSLTDGEGEAAIDLMPGSDFLRRLNQRPRPAHTRYTIIAGRVSPVSEQQFATFSDSVRALASDAKAPSWLRNWVDTAGRETSDLLAAAVRGTGDGAVTLDSTRLDDVEDYVIIEANHLSMLVNLLGTDELPPAIPIILDRLSPPTAD